MSEMSPLSFDLNTEKRKLLLFFGGAITFTKAFEVQNIEAQFGNFMSVRNF